MRIAEKMLQKNVCFGLLAYATFIPICLELDNFDANASVYYGVPAKSANLGRLGCGAHLGSGPSCNSNFLSNLQTLLTPGA